MKVYITKYALSSGIRVEEAEVIKGSASIILIKGYLCGNKYYHDDDWHTDWPSAKAQAGRMRVNRIASLNWQISKLMALHFECPDEEE